METFHCPNCKAILKSEFTPQYHNEYIDVYCYCEGCGFKTPKFDGKMSYCESALENYIKEYKKKYNMSLQEAINSGLKFKLPEWEYWIWVDKKGNFTNGTDIITIPPKQILRNDWMVANQWYQGDNFKNKYPNGVVCWCWNIGDKKKNREIVINYIEGNFPFKTDSSEYQYAEPIKTKEAPVIIGK